MFAARQTVSRRRFLQLLGIASAGAVIKPNVRALGAAGLGLGQVDQYDDGSSTIPGELAGDPERVIVVGAGFAGLAVANALANAGVECIVLESRDRLGGRAWT